MAKVILKQVKKVYPPATGKKGAVGQTAVDNFNLEIQDREFVVLVGPSGCGKSTTLRLIAGLEELSGGDIYIGDKLVNNVVPKDRDIAMVFQNYALYPHMTVYENMAFSLKLKKVDKAVIDQKVRQAAEILGISNYLGRKPKALSGGERQRVAIGRAIVREPQVFLMDEPLSNLDANLRNQMRSEIIKLHQRLNTTFIYVTHDQTEAMTLGDRIVIMKDGIIRQVGTPQEVFDHPADLFVAGFIGLPQMNFFHGRLVKDGSGYSFAMGDTIIPLLPDVQKALTEKDQPEGNAVLGVRPDHIQLANKGLAAAVEVTEMMGSAIHAHVKVYGEEAVVIIPTMNLSNEQRAYFRSGAMLQLDLSAGKQHLFDTETGKNILF